MILEEQRFLHEDLERLEQAISDRVLEDPKNIRDRLNRDHHISDFLNRIQEQSQRLVKVYDDPEGARTKEIQSISTGDPFDEFYKQLQQIKEFHRRYPNEPVENLERAYKRKPPGDGDLSASEIDKLFSGEEAFGRFFDLTTLHEEYLNLPNVKRLSYLQYLDLFDTFTPPQFPLKRADKMKDVYFQYLGGLVSYLESFLRRTKPLEDIASILESLDEEFETAWRRDLIRGWAPEATTAGPTAPTAEGSGEGFWCADCQQEFKNTNVFKHHLSGKKHKRAAANRQANGSKNGVDGETDGARKATEAVSRLKERAVAEREFRIRKLASAMQTERSDTRVNVERRQGMTERERQQELEAIYAEAAEPIGMAKDGGSDDEDEEKLYNPLKLPLAWDGKPIPFWLYKLHGLGVEFPCQICGNFVYMGRRAFDKHFNEARHIYGLKCLGITNTTLFREITRIDEAQKLWLKLQQDKKQEKSSTENIVQMEDSEGNVMPEKVYYDLQKQGLV